MLMGEMIRNHIVYVTSKADEIMKRSSGVLAYD